MSIGPAPPTEVKSANPTCSSINITWSAPNYTGGVPLERYTVRWSGRGSPLMTDGPDVTAVIVTPLSPNTSYTITVTAVNAIGEGQESEQLMVITEPQGWCYKELHIEELLHSYVGSCIVQRSANHISQQVASMQSRAFISGNLDWAETFGICLTCWLVWFPDC